MDVESIALDIAAEYESLLAQFKRETDEVFRSYLSGKLEELHRELNLMGLGHLVSDHLEH